MVDSRKIAILGAGRIGEALISGLLSSEWRKPAEIAATTRRAERVAELRERYGIEATLSTRDAAAGELFLSTKTIEFHLRNAYRKLGVRSRTELANALRGGEAVAS